MYDEFERAVGAGGPRKGLSPLGWLMVSAGFFVLAGVVGVGFAVTRVVDRVERAVRDVAVDAGAVARRVVTRLDSHTALLAASPEQGLAYLQDLGTGDPEEAFLRNLVEDPFRPSAHVAGPDAGARSVRPDRGDVRFDLVRGEDGGSLVIGSDQGRVRLDLVRTEAGGTLTIDSDDGRARIDLVRTDEGGFLVMDSDEGRVRFDLVRSDDGGRLLIRTDDDELSLGFGQDAEGVPSWVPRLDGMPDAPRPVYSLRSGAGVLGAVAWDDDASTGEVMAFYRDRLEGERYDIRAEHRRVEARAEHGSLWARREADGRVVFVVAHETGGETRVLLGYGEKR